MQPKHDETDQHNQTTLFHIIKIWVLYLGMCEIHTKPTKWLIQSIFNWVMHWIGLDASFENPIKLDWIVVNLFVCWLCFVHYCLIVVRSQIYYSINLMLKAKKIWIFGLIELIYDKSNYNWNGYRVLKIGCLGIVHKKNAWELMHTP
jgi:hypothetical protein